MFKNIFSVTAVYVMIVVFLSTTTLVYAADGDNNFLLAFQDSPSDIIDSNTRDIVAGSDLDQDGKYEIIVTDYDNGGQVHVFEVVGDNNVMWVWSSPGTPSGGPFPAREVKTGDLDNDGIGEILVSISKDYTPSDSSGIYVYEWDGVNDNGYVLAAVIPVDLSLTSGYTEDFVVDDIDGDNITEVVFLNNGTDVEDNCYIISISGTFETVWTQVTEATFTRAGGDFAGGPYDVTVGDLDGDNFKEVIVSVTEDSGGIFIAEAIGSDLYVASRYIHVDTTGSNGYSLESMATDDFDGDGADELFIVLNNSNVNLVVVTGGTDVSSITFENNIRYLRVDGTGGLGMAIGDQDHGAGSDGPDIYFCHFGSWEEGGYIQDFEYTGTDVFDPSSYTEHVIFQDTEIFQPAGLFQLNAPSVDLDGDGNRELLLSYTGDSPNGIQIKIFEFDPVSASLTLSSPNGGETWEFGTVQNVSWSSNHFIGSLKIEYSTDGGSNWKDIISYTADDGSYDWPIPNDPSSNCLVRVSKMAMGIPFDESNGTFSIISEILFSDPNFSASAFYDSIPGPDGIAVISDDSLLVVNEFGGIGPGVFLAIEGDQFGVEDAYSTIGAPFVSPDDLLLYPDGTAFVADGQAQTVFKIPIGGGTPVSFVTTATTGSPNFNPFGLAIAPANFDGPNVDPGDIIIADNAYGTIYKAVWAVNPNTGVAKIIAQGNVFVDGPLTPAFASNGTLFIFENNDSGSSRIVILSSDGVVTLFFSGIESRSALAIHPITDELFFKKVSGEIYSVPKTGGTSEQFASNIGSYQDLAFNEDGTALFMSTPGRKQVIKITGPFYFSGVSVVIPDTSGQPATTINIPVRVITDVTGMGIIAAEIELSWNVSVLDNASAALGAMASGWSMSYNSAPGSGQMSIWMAGTEENPPIDDLAGTGSLVMLTFDVVGQNLDSTLIHFEKMVFNEGDPSVVPRDGLFKVFTGWDITGNIYYCLNNDPVDDAIVSAIATSYKDTTDVNGDYELLDLPEDNYVVKPEKENDTGNAISAYDAAWILQYGVGLRTFEPCQMIAGDVSGNGGVSAFDAAKILQYGVGLINQFPVMPDSTHFWRFVPEDSALTLSNWMNAPDSIAYTPLNSNVVDNYKAIVYGDVSGNWHPSDGGLAKSVVANVDIRLEDVYGKAGDKISLPINMDNASGIIAMNFTLQYDPQVLKAVGASLTSLTRDYIIAHAVKDGQIRVGLAGSKPIVGSGAIVNLEFEVLETESPNAGSVLDITEMMINDGSIVANIQAARFEMGSAVPDEYALHQNYPNPFNPETMIKYQLPKSGKVVLKIYNSIGQEIRILVNEEKEAGYHEVRWDGRDNSSVSVSSGIYIYRIQVGDFVSSKKMIFMR